MSLVYVNDVADVIMKLLDPKPLVLDQAFNLAFKETPTLLEFLTDMKVCVLRFFVSKKLKFITLNNTKFYDFVKEGLRAASQSEVFCQMNPLGPISSSLLMLLKGALLLISLSRLPSQGSHHAPGQFVKFSYCRSPCLCWSIPPLAGYILNAFHEMGRAVQF